MIADGLHLLLNLPDLGWAITEAPKKRQTQKLKGKKHTRANLQGKKQWIELPSVDTSSLIDKLNPNTMWEV